MGEYSPVLNRGRSRFAQRLPATIATAAAVLLFAVLGNWQLDRAVEKRAVIADFERGGVAPDLLRLPGDARRFQRVSARGHYEPERQFLLDNRIHEARPGVHVLTPLVLGDGSAVLVNRGWLPFGKTRRDLPDTSVNAEPRVVAGRIDTLARPAIELPAKATEGWPKLVQYPRMDELSTQLGRELHPRVILLDPWESDGYIRAWAPPGATPARHLAYAVQWFAFAALAAAIWFVLGLRRTGDAA